MLLDILHALRRHSFTRRGGPSQGVGGRERPTESRAKGRGMAAWHAGGLRCRRVARGPCACLYGRAGRLRSIKDRGKGRHSQARIDGAGGARAQAHPGRGWLGREARSVKPAWHQDAREPGRLRRHAACHARWYFAAVSMRINEARERGGAGCSGGWGSLRLRSVQRFVWVRHATRGRAQAQPRLHGVWSPPWRQCGGAAARWVFCVGAGVVEGV
jgi:hypothetical protein